MNSIKLGNEIKEIRESKQWTQVELVKRVERLNELYGMKVISRSHLSEIENGKIEGLTLAMFETLVYALEVEPEVLYRAAEMKVRGQRFDRVIYIGEDMTDRDYAALQRMARLIETGTKAEKALEEDMKKTLEEQKKEVSSSFIKNF